MSCWSEEWGYVWGLGCDTPIERPPLMDTRDIDALRQGVSMLTNRHRYAGVQPKIWVGDLSHEHVQLTFGIENLWRGYSAFDDLRRGYNINDIINHITSGSTVPVTTAFASASDDDGEIEMFNGVIEPLDLRTSLPQHTPFKTDHAVRGEFAEGSRGDPILQYRFLDTTNLDIPYIEVGIQQTQWSGSYVATTGINSGSTVSRPELLKPSVSASVEDARVDPFDDSIALTPVVPKSYITSSRDNFIDVLSNRLSGSTDVFELERKISAGAGIIFHDSRYGMDSLAFGGLKRYRSGSA